LIHRQKKDLKLNSKKSASGALMKIYTTRTFFELVKKVDFPASDSQKSQFG